MPDDAGLRRSLLLAILTIFGIATLAVMARHGSPKSVGQAMRLGADLLVGFGLGLATAAIPLYFTYPPLTDKYTRVETHEAWVTLALLVGPFLAALYVGWRHSTAPWTWSLVVTCGFMSGIIADIVVRLSLGIPSTVWPIAIVVNFVLTTPAIVTGIFVAFWCKRFLGGKASGGSA